MHGTYLMQKSTTLCTVVTVVIISMYCYQQWSNQMWSDYIGRQTYIRWWIPMYALYSKILNLFFLLLAPPYNHKREKRYQHFKYVASPQNCKLPEDMHLNFPFFYTFTSSHHISVPFWCKASPTRLNKIWSWRTGEEYCK